MFTVIFFCLFGLVAAQQPRPCTSPPQWEGRIFDSNEKQQGSVRGRISYDSVYHRIRVIKDIEIGTEENIYDVLTLADAGLQFIYDLKARNCTRLKFTDPWRDFSIAADARSYGEAYIGSSALPDTGVLITIWGGNFTIPASNETLPYIATWTYKGCLPVSHTTYSQKYGNEVLSFYDLTIGISDPNVFIPRPECLTQQEYAMRQSLFGTPAKLN